VRQTSYLLWTKFGVASKLHVMLDVLSFTAIIFVCVQKLCLIKSFSIWKYCYSSALIIQIGNNFP